MGEENSSLCGVLVDPAKEAQRLALQADIVQCQEELKREKGTLEGYTIALESLSTIPYLKPIHIDAHLGEEIWLRTNVAYLHGNEALLYSKQLHECILLLNPVLGKCVKILKRTASVDKNMMNDLKRSLKSAREDIQRSYSGRTNDAMAKYITVCEKVLDVVETISLERHLHSHTL